MFSKTPGCPQGSLINISLLEYVSFWEWFLMHRPCSNGYTSVSELKPDSFCSQADVTLNHPHNNFTMCSSTQTPPHTLSAEIYFTWKKIPIYTPTIQYLYTEIGCLTFLTTFIHLVSFILMLKCFLKLFFGNADECSRLEEKAGSRFPSLSRLFSLIQFVEIWMSFK